MVPDHQGHRVTLHISEFPGDNALSGFRIRHLLPLIQSIHPGVQGLLARHVHLVASDEPLSATAKGGLSQLLGPAMAWAEGNASDLVVSPRLGTVSPWASKATDIARNCGFALHRIERVTQYQFVLDGWDSPRRRSNPTIGRTPA